VSEHFVKDNDKLVIVITWQTQSIPKKNIRPSVQNHHNVLHNNVAN